MSDLILDVRNLLCPMPVIRTQDQVGLMKKGDILQIRCTDHGVINDIPAWCRINGHDVLSIDEQKDEIVIRLQVGENR